MAVNGSTQTPPMRLLRAIGFFQRLRGLIGRTSMGLDEAFLLERCSAVHTIGMRMPIDLIFLSSDGVVLKVVERVRPGRFSMCCGAAHALELAAGAVVQRRVRVGMRARVSRSRLTFDSSYQGGPS